ncbi:peptidoglycan-binding domain-containing protein [Catellatospora sp. NPDC049609]|uniref:peptidoglycan-binding domain-containing protein n=1 Tax=Catellatospora sp. NPDC049609 TaxID=3155505 RepID=UPI003433096E
MSTRLARMVSAVFAAMVAATVLSVAAPAQAATPTCNASGTVTAADGYTHINIPMYYVASTNTRNYTCLLSVGNSSNAVYTLERTLKEQYGYNITVNTAFTTETKNALLDLQAELCCGLDVDGVYGPQTRDALCWVQVGGGGCMFRVW